MHTREDLRSRATSVCLLYFEGLWTGGVDEDVLGGICKLQKASLRGGVSKFMTSARLSATGRVDFNIENDLRMLD